LQDEVRDDGRIIGGEVWQGKVHNREEWKKLLRTARDRRIRHVPTEKMNKKKNVRRQRLLCESIRFCDGR
jgi:hypothetical protein